MKRPVPMQSASAFIDGKIKELGDWRGKMLAKVREIIHEADPEIVEEWKMALKDSQSAAERWPGDQEEHRYIVMPMRL